MKTLTMRMVEERLSALRKREGRTGDGDIGFVGKTSVTFAEVAAKGCSLQKEGAKSVPSSSDVLGRRETMKLT